MHKKPIFLILFLIVFANQSNSQSIENFEKINKIWDTFYKAFDSLDYMSMAKIHSKKLIRISGGKKIIDYGTYIKGYKTTFEKAKEDMVSNTISLRFFERIHNDSVASERGIYKLVRNKNQGNQQIYYGQFHVLFAKENGIWKIIMDYDSNEGNSIGEKEYLNAYGINQFDVFMKQ